MDKPDPAISPVDTKRSNSNLSDASAANSDPPPPASSMYRYLMYGCSLPERAIRSTAAVLGGATAGSAAVLVPRLFQDSKTYQTFVKQMLDLLANDVGGVVVTPSNVDPDASESPEVGNYVAQKAVSSFVDLAGMATLHLSPMTILAIISDVAHGSKFYLTELAAELKREGIIAEDSTINSTADLLGAIGAASADSTDALDMPPIDLESLQATLAKTSQNLAQIDPTKLIPQSEISKIWAEMNALAQQENVTLFELSSAVTMYSLDQVTNVGRGTFSTVKVTRALLDQHLVDHYRQGLREINQKGLYSVLAEHSKPYLDAVWFNFAADRPTVTEDLLSGKMIGRAVNGLGVWLLGPADQDGSKDTEPK